MINLPNPFSSIPTAVEKSIVCPRCGRAHGCVCSHRHEYVFDPVDFMHRFKTLTSEQIDEINRREDLIPILILMRPEQDYKQEKRK